MCRAPCGTSRAPGRSQRERARTHPYLTERMLARSPLWPASASAPRCTTSASTARATRRVCAATPSRSRRGSWRRPTCTTRSANRAAPPALSRRCRRTNASGRGPGRAPRRRCGQRRARCAPGTACAAAPGSRRAHAPRGRRARRAGPGRSNPEIATALAVSRKTVSSHLEHIYAKLGVCTRTEAALFAMRPRARLRPQVTPRPDRRSGTCPRRRRRPRCVQRMHDDRADSDGRRRAAVRRRRHASSTASPARTSMRSPRRSLPDVHLPRPAPGGSPRVDRRRRRGRTSSPVGSATHGLRARRCHRRRSRRTAAAALAPASAAERLGDGWFIVEQQVYADAGDDGRIARLDLLCTGYRPEDAHV